MSHPDVHALRIEADDGVGLAASRMGRSTPAATLVYVHPLGGERGFWSPLTCRVHRDLSGAVTQIVYDQRGHGDSGTPHRREVTTLRRLADDLDTVLAHASGPVVLVAHSTGAHAVYAYATAHRDRARELAGLVFFNATAEPLALPRYVYTWPPRLLRSRRHRILYPVAAVGEAALTRRLRRTGYLFAGHPGTATRVTVDILGTHPGFGLHTEIAEQLSHIPSVVLAGEQDTLVPSHQAVRLADALAADYDIVAGAGHYLPHTHTERAADTITATLDDALRTRLERCHHLPDTGPRRA